MPSTRRSITLLAGTTLIAPSFARLATANATANNATPNMGTANSPFGERAIGSPDAKVKAIEYFSLTCTHCAYFATVTMTKVKPDLIDTNKLQIVFKDFPLDQVALMAAQVARSLPPAQYYPFIDALFASQNDWAFKPGVNYVEAIYKYAALAGMARADYDAALHNTALQKFILDGQQEAEKMYNVNSTPSFIINGKLYVGAMEYPDFAALINRLAQGQG